eukprot:scaffold5287_cov345-Prasinococcus_capsulatus_cf.AAC.6
MKLDGTKTDDPKEVIDAYWRTDEAFGAQRLSGASPLFISKVRMPELHRFASQTLLRIDVSLAWTMG